jgi:carbon monoxide dehydrogenase subunit G
VGAIGQLGSPRIHSREEIVAYDPPRRLAYTILSGQPVRGYRADVDLTPDGDGTAIRWVGTFEPKVPGTGALVRWFFSAVIGATARRLAAEAARR